MNKVINEIPRQLCQGDEPIDGIRAAVHKMVDIAMSEYTDDLLKAAFDMACAVAQFANELEDGHTT